MAGDGVGRVRFPFVSDPHFLCFFAEQSGLVVGTHKAREASVSTAAWQAAGLILANAYLTLGYSCMVVLGPVVNDGTSTWIGGGVTKRNCHRRVGGT